MTNEERAKALEDYETQKRNRIIDEVIAAVKAKGV